jgi:hypothetical protein
MERGGGQHGARAIQRNHPPSVRLTPLTSSRISDASWGHDVEIKRRHGRQRPELERIGDEDRTPTGHRLCHTRRTPSIGGRHRDRRCPGRRRRCSRRGRRPRPLRSGAARY